MFPYRGLAILIALCAFGAIQASFETEFNFESFKHHGHHNSSNSTGQGPSGNQSHPHHPGHNNSHPGGNHSHPHHPGHNSSHPIGNNTHPHHPGHNNGSHPHHPAGNQSHPHYPNHPHHPPPPPPGHANSSGPSNITHRPGHSNSSHWSAPKNRYPFKPHMGFKPIRPIHQVYPNKNHQVSQEKQVEPHQESRGFFNKFFNVSKPVYHHRPQVVNNSSWYRPSNNSWSIWG